MFRSVPFKNKSIKKYLSKYRNKLHYMLIYASDSHCAWNFKVVLSVLIIVAPHWSSG